MACADCGKLIRRKPKSRPPGVATCQDCRRKARLNGPPSKQKWTGPTMKCAGCGEPMAKTHTSRPEGVATCRPCQRRARGLTPDQLVRDYLRKKPELRECPECSEPFETTRRKFCSDECFRKARNRRGQGSPARKSTTERGYGGEHQRLRKELLPHAYEQACSICLVQLEPGDKIHLDHTEDRSGYRGFSHAWCNSHEGAKRGGLAMSRRSRVAS